MDEKFDIKDIPDTADFVKDINITDIYISKESIFNALLALDISKGVGVDNISPVFLKCTANFLSYPLHYNIII